MTTPLTLSTHQRPDGIPVVTAVGEIDMSNAGTFRDALTRASAADGRLVVDLTEVEYRTVPALRFSSRTRRTSS